MNRFYRLVWTSWHQAWLAVSEVSRGRQGDGRSRAARQALVNGAVLVFSGGAVAAQAAPTTQPQGNADDRSVFPAIGSTTTVAGTAPTFACEGSAHAEPDCGNRQPAGAYVVVTPLHGVSSLLSGKVMVQVGPDVLRTGAFSTALPEEATQALRAQAARAVVSMADGQSLPAWLSFDARTFSIAAHAMPPAALPVTVLVRKGVYEVEVEISSLKQVGAAGSVPGK